MSRNLALHEDGAKRRIESGGEEIERNLMDIVLEARGIGIARRQRVVVGDEEEALVLMLKLDPVVERTHIVAEVQPARGAHTAEDAAARRVRCIFSHCDQNQGYMMRQRGGSAGAG